MGRDWTCMAFWTSSLAFRAAATSAGSGAWTCARGWRFRGFAASGATRAAAFRRGDGVRRGGRGVSAFGSVAGPGAVS